jgi:hypothetical protein
MKNTWPKKETRWIHDGNLFISIPFTWLLPRIREELRQMDFGYSAVIVGGPAVDLMPDYLDGIKNVSRLGVGLNGVLQRVNPYATRTTVGCPNKCKYCAVPTIEGSFDELKTWSLRPIICDNNILAASEGHWHFVVERLMQCTDGSIDFEQGLDCRLLKDYHAEGMARLDRSGPGCMVRLALDSGSCSSEWKRSKDMLRDAGVRAHSIRSYALIGFDSGPVEAWERCNFIKSNNVLPLPMWFHELDALKLNQVTEKQKDLGWSNEERMKIMRHFYG